MSDPLEINETNIGTLVHTGNELLNYSTVEDPAAYRLGAPEDQRSLGKISGDVIEDGKGEEVVLIQLKQTGDNVPDGRRGGEFYLGLNRPGGGSTDGAMVDALVATVDEGFQFKLPIYAPNLGGGGGGTNEFATGISSRNGKYRLQVQDDGNLVYYDYTQSPPRVLKLLGSK